MRINILFSKLKSQYWYKIHASGINMNEVLYDIASPLVSVGESALSDPSDVNIQ